MILANAFVRVADEADVARIEIGKPAEIIADLQRFRMCIERVDREITARCVFLPLGRKGHGSPAAIGRHVVAQGGDLDRPALEDRGHRAVIDARGHRADARFLAPVDHRVRQQRCRKVDVVDVLAQQRVAHRPADVARVVRPQRGHEGCEVLALGPVGLRQAVHARAFRAVSPSTPAAATG